MTRPILIVDDEVQIRTLISIVLKRHGFDVIEAQDARSALQLLDSVKPGLFLLDIMMPEIDGIELCRRLRARKDTATTPIIIISAIQDQRRVRSSLEAGADEFVSKTSIQPDLVQKVRQLLTTEKAHIQ